LPTILVPLNLVIAAFAAGGLWVSGTTMVVRDGIAAIAIGSIVAYASKCCRILRCESFGEVFNQSEFPEGSKFCFLCRLLKHIRN
jgi:hypothetical protein